MSSREYYFAHRDEQRAKRKALYLKDLTRELAVRREWYQKNKETALAKNREYYRQHANLFTLRNARRRAANMSAEGHHSAPDLELIWQRQKQACACCKTPLTKKRGERLTRTLDHIVALINNGSNWPDNLQWLCKSCNCKKSAQDDIAWAQRELGLLFAL